MKKFPLALSFVLLGLAGLVISSPADSIGPAHPPVWIMPPGHENGIHIQELFDHPDQWAQTRSKITGIGLADWQIGKYFSPAQLQVWAKLLKQWNLKFCVEVGAIKKWGLSGADAFNVDSKYWDKYIAAGGTIDSIAMDEPLVSSRLVLHKPDSYAVEQTARFVQLVHQHYPNTRIGDIEGYPALSYDDLTKWIDALQAKLKSMHAKGLDFFRIDTDWVNFIVDNGKGSWPQLKKLEMFTRSRNLPFSLIYWAADLPALRELGEANDSTWYFSTLQEGADYKLVQGSPDEIVIESWVKAPSHTLPETGDSTFTRSVLDFCNLYVK